MHVTAIIAAGGRGLRFGGALPKQLTAVGGRAILERSVTAFVGHPEIDEIVVALPADIAADPPAYLVGRSKPLRVVDGGARRQDSVMNAFRATSERTDVIVIHDAARPFASADLISRTIAAAAQSGAALAAVPARDTSQEIDQSALKADALRAGDVASRDDFSRADAAGVSPSRPCATRWRATKTRPTRRRSMRARGPAVTRSSMARRPTIKNHDPCGSGARRRKRPREAPHLEGPRGQAAPASATTSIASSKDGR